MEWLWIREIRRAARRASAPFTRQIVLACGAAAAGTMVASVLPTQWDGVVAQASWGRKLAPRALPTSEDEVRPRRAAEGPLAFVR